MNWQSIRGLLLSCGALVLGALAPAGVAAQGVEAEAVLKARCAECHERLPDGSINRISHQRKTPEGWQMTITRMTLIHGVQVTPDERRTLVKYLSDRQGLAPSEAKPFRYILERTPNLVEATPEGDLGVLCARCHSYARVALQRRDAAEWTKLSHFHLGQFPTAEYQAGGRDREWWKIVSTEAPKTLGKMYPFKTKEWTEWQKKPKAALEGTWRVAGYRPGQGALGGTATIAKSGADRYTVTYALADADGKPIQGAGNAIVYTGYEWRGTGKLGSEDVREVYAVSNDGNTIEGRWFVATSDETGGRLTLVRDGKPAVAGLSRSHLKVGETARLTVWGSGLGDKVDLGPGVTAKVVERRADALVVEATASPKATVGAHTVAAGKAKATGLLTVYDKIDAVKVEPALAIARVGGGGGKTVPVTAQFEAVAYLAGPDGKPGTDDDVRIGAMPADWSTEPFNDAAREMADDKFAGGFAANGLFQPAVAGPNPERVYGTNNVGDLTVKATVKDGAQTVEGTGRVIATVQRWVDPPIR